MEDDPERVSTPFEDPADAVAQLRAVVAPLALHRTAVDREDDGIALAQRHDRGARLHARALLGQHEFATAEVDPRLRQQHRHLQRKDMLSVQVLVQAVVVASAVLQQQRRGSALASSG